MVDTFPASQSLRTLYSADPTERQLAALERFYAQGWPNRKDEEFRFGPYERLSQIEFKPVTGGSITQSALTALSPLDLQGPRLVFVNGRVAPELSRNAEASGVTVRMVEAPFSDGPVIADYSGKLGSTNDPRFLDLNAAFATQIALVDIANGVESDHAIEIIHVSAGLAPSLNCPRTYIRLGANAHAQVVESFVGEPNGGLTNAVTEIWLDVDATLEYDRLQREPLSHSHIGNAWAHQERGSTLISNSVQFGADIGRVDTNVWVNGERAETSLNGVYVGRDSQTLDNKTRIDHAKPNCHSFEVYKGILDDSAQGVFNGKIFVYEDAQKTDAKQTNQALLLSPEAGINTKPQLEIFADDVKCTHSATVGQLQKDQLFYLTSRGIPVVQARNMLVHAFAAEALEKIGVLELREFLEAELYEKLGR